MAAYLAHATENFPKSEHRNGAWQQLYSQCMPFAQKHADRACAEGIKKLGMSAHEAPALRTIADAVRSVGWNVIGVRGLIPPRAFALHLAERVLPIVVDLRPSDKMDFSPEPDLFHETFGHACQLFSDEYRTFLQDFGRLAALAFPAPDDELRAKHFRETAELKAKNVAFDNASYLHTETERLSEREILTRFGWWTFEVGLIDRAAPKIFGAALLSSISEAQRALADSDLWRTLRAEHYLKAFDPTEPQTQYIVFDHVSDLQNALREIEAGMAFRIGGATGLQRAFEAGEQAAVALLDGRILRGAVISLNQADEVTANVQLSGPESPIIQISASNVKMVCPLEAFHLLDVGQSTNVDRM